MAKKDKNELNLQLALDAHRLIDEDHTELNRHVSENTTQAIRSLFLLSGGGTIALLGFMSVVKTNEAASIVLNATYLFTWSCFLTVFVSVLAYCTNYCYAEAKTQVIKTWDHPYSTETDDSERLNTIGKRFHTTALIIAFLSMALFICGLIQLSGLQSLDWTKVN